MSLQQIQQPVAFDSGRTHEIVVIDPKPGPQQLRELVRNYFDDNAANYDSADEHSPKRRKYTDTVNRLVAGFLGQERDLTRILSIAAGTGRREEQIKSLLSSRVRITCTDLSAKMCSLAAARGHEVMCGPWDSIDLGKQTFDSVLFLYSFGQLVDKTERLTALKKVNRHLRYQGSLYLDVFNIDDVDEWGPELSQRFKAEAWDRKGYERGDVIYRKVDSTESALSYCHYFAKEEIEQLLKSAGLRISRILHIGYGNAPGTVMPTNIRGTMLIRATKFADT
jgi:ubiquinone/menaquinone biosynthesis C-methylase UbiE